jgi:PilZ domain/SPOR domain
MTVIPVLRELSSIDHMSCKWSYWKTMEQVRHARIPVHLDAVLIGKKTVPKGCKVRNVSNHGLLLQCDADGRIQTFRDDDLVDIHLLFQRPDGTKYLTITATVRHVDTNGIGVEFCQPDRELIRLIESYRIDETQSLEATISHSRKAAGSSGPAIVVTHPASVASAHTERRKPAGNASGRSRYYFGLLLLVVAVGIFTADYLRTFGLSSRVAALESLVGARDVELARFQSQFLARDAAVDVADKNRSAVKSGGSVSTPESEVSAVAPLQQDALATSPTMETAVKAGAEEVTSSPSSGQSSEEETTAAMIVKPAGFAGQVVASAYVDSQDAEKRGSWVINLLSSPNKSDADQFADKARKQGIPVEQETIRLKGREFFRVQLTGFLTENQAEENAGPVKKRLGLKDVWIFKP